MHLSNTYLVLIVDSSKEVQRHRSERRLSEERCRDYIDCKLLSLLQRIHKIILQQLMLDLSTTSLHVHGLRWGLSGAGRHVGAGPGLVLPRHLRLPLEATSLPKVLDNEF